MPSVHILVGLGGVGQRIVRETMVRMRTTDKSIASTFVKAAYLDFAPEGADEFETPEVGIVALADAAHLEIDAPGPWITRRAVRNEFKDRWPKTGSSELYVPPLAIGHGNFGGQIRANGQAAFEEGTEDIRDNFQRLYNSARTLIGKEAAYGRKADRVIVWVIASSAGGTGAGTIVSFMALARMVMEGSATDHLVGLLIDHSVMQLRQPGTGNQGHALLVELDRFMAIPDDFRIESANRTTVTSGTEGNRKHLAELVYLVSAKNRQGQTLDAGTSGDPTLPYRGLSAGWLQSMILLDFDAQAKNFIENTLQGASGLDLVGGRCVNYAGLGYSRVTFPAADVCRWSANRAVVDLLNNRMLRGYASTVPPETGLKSHFPHLVDGIPSLVDWLKAKAAKGGDAPIERARAAKVALARLKSTAQLRNHLDQNALREPGAVDKWLSECSALSGTYRAGVDRWLGEFETSFRNAVEAELSQLSSGAAADLCTDMVAVLAQIEARTRNELAPADQLAAARSAYVKTAAAGVVERKLTQRLGFGETFDEALKHVDAALGKLLLVIEARAVKGAVTDLLARAKTVAESLALRANDAKALCAALSESSSKTLRLYSVGDKLQLSSFVAAHRSPVELQVGAASEVLEEVGSDLYKKLSEEADRALQCITDTSGSWPGLSAVLDELARRRNSKASVQDMQVLAQRCTVVDATVARALEFLRRDWPFDVIIDRHISVDRENVQRINPGPDRQQWLTTRFGTMASDFQPLVQSTQIDQGKWRATWLTAMLRDLKDRATPFLGTSGVFSAWHSTYADELNRVMQTGAGVKKGLRDDDVQVITSQDVVDNSDLGFAAAAKRAAVTMNAIPRTEYEMMVIRQWGLVCLPVVESVVASRDAYRQHVESGEGQGYPIHTDSRFHAAWRDDLGDEARRGGYPEFLYVLALGSGLLSYERGRGLLSSMPLGTTDRKIVGESLPKALEALGSEPATRVALARAVLGSADNRDQWRKAGDGDQPAMQAILHQFAVAAKAHDGLKPPTTQVDAFVVWQRIRDSIDVYEEAGGQVMRGKKASMVPEYGDSEAFANLFKQLRKMADEA